MTGGATSGAVNAPYPLTQKKRKKKGVNCYPVRTETNDFWLPHGKMGRIDSRSSGARRLEGGRDEQRRRLLDWDNVAEAVVFLIVYHQSTNLAFVY